MAHSNGYAIQIDNQPIDPIKIETEKSRKTSTSSQQSLNSSALESHQSCFSPLNYDSGNYSVSDFSNACRPPSLSSVEDADEDHQSYNEQLQNCIREKDQTLFLALQDVRKLKSELDRISKSEKWYKNELKTQKRSRLEILEKLYLNERNFLRENQKLQTECTRLFSLCGEAEKSALHEKEFLLKQLKEAKDRNKCYRDNSPNYKDKDSLQYEIRKLKATVQEHENLIEVLRKQKQSLLNDLRSLTIEKDSKIILLEKNSAALEEENRKITQKCKDIILQKQKLIENSKKTEVDLKESNSNNTCKKCIEQNLDNQYNLPTFQVLNKHLEQITKFENQNSNMPNIQNRTHLELNSNNNLESFFKDSCNSTELQQYKYELTKKISEIESFKILHQTQNDRILALQNEITNFAELRAKFEEQQRDIEKLQFQLHEKNFEVENLKSFHLNQTTEISKLQNELFEYKKLRDNFERYASLLKANNVALEKKENELMEMQKFVRTQTLEIENLRKINTEINYENEKVVSELQKLKNEVDDKQKDLEINDCLVNELRSFINNQKDEITKLIKYQNNFEKLQISFDELKIVLQNKNLEISTQKSEIEKLTSDNLILQNNVIKYNETCQNLETLKVELDIRNRDFEQIKFEKENLEKLKIHYDELNKSFDHMQLELQNKNCNLQSLEIEQKQFETLKICYDEICKKYELLSQDLHIKTSDLGKLQLEKINFEKLQFEYAELLKNSQNESTEMKQYESVKAELAVKSSELENMKLVQKHNKENSPTHLKIEISQQKIETLRALLVQQSGRLTHLNAEQEEWQQLLENLNETQKLMNQSFIDLEEKNNEIDKLNNLLIKQSKNLKRLQREKENYQNDESKKMEETKEIETLKNEIESNKFEQNQLKLELESKVFEVSTLNEKLSKLHENFENQISEKNLLLNQKECEITNLKENLQSELSKLRQQQENAISNFNFEFSKERDKHKNEIKKLKNKIVEIEFEKESLTNEKLNIEKELTKNIKITEIFENEKLKYEEKVLNLTNQLENYECKGCSKSNFDIEASSFSLAENSDDFELPEETTKIDSVNPLQLTKQISKLNSNSPISIENSPSNSQSRLSVFSGGSQGETSEMSEELKYAKTLNKVLENEKQRKTIRYEAYVRSLLSNIKSYKKNLEILESHHGNLIKKYEKLENEIEKVKDQEVMKCESSENENERKLQEMTRKYEESQEAVKTLKQQLETARNQFIEIDVYKRVNSNLKNNLTNLMDDYKAVIHSKLNSSNQNKTSVNYSHIYDLINKSNNCVPNLNAVTQSIDDLKTDIEKIKINSNNRYSNSPLVTRCITEGILPSLRFAQERKKSLMDELKEASFSS